jgi:DNA-binding NarL/FixJ family response regulator
MILAALLEFRLELRMERQAHVARVLIADDHPTTREGLCALLEREADMEVVAQASDGREAVSLFRAHRPDLTLMDLHMPHMGGLEAAAAIRSEFPQAVIVALTSYEGDARVARALSLGMRSYILKTTHPKDVRLILRRVLKGEIVVEQRLASAAVELHPRDCLTSRELSVVKLIAHGKPNRDIGQALSVSEDTVKARIKNILAKLGANDRAHAVTLARDRGFLDF